MTTNILTIKFKNEIRPFEVSLFRGAIINSLDNKLLLFHDHDGDKLRYNYPLIQYKRIGGCAAIQCLNQGTEEIGELFASNRFTLHLDDRIIEAEIASIVPSKFNIQTWDKSFSYTIRRWLAFNSENYQKFLQMESIVDRVVFLENILKGNILSFAKGLSIWIDGTVTCKITKLSDPFTVEVKGVKMMSFNAEFLTNVSIPDFIGLGKHVSIGFGIVSHNKKEYNNDKN